MFIPKNWRFNFSNLSAHSLILSSRHWSGLQIVSKLMIMAQFIRQPVFAVPDNISSSIWRLRSRPNEMLHVLCLFNHGCLLVFVGDVFQGLILSLVKRKSMVVSLLWNRVGDLVWIGQVKTSYGFSFFEGRLAFAVWPWVFAEWVHYLLQPCHWLFQVKLIHIEFSHAFYFLAD